MGFFIGLDIGTTSTKVFIYDEQGGIRGGGKAGYPLLVPEPGRAEQRPQDILAAVVEAFRQAMQDGGVRPSEIEAVGVSAAMHSLMAVDRDGQPLTPLLTWADNRSAPQIAELKQKGLDRELYALTGTPVHPMSPLGKLIWWKEQQPGLFTEPVRFISIKEYVLHEFFGVYALDTSVASATGLLHISGKDWCPEALELAGVRRESLGELMPVTAVLRGMKPEMAEACGLSADTPWVVGASDGALANIGSGAAGLERTAVTIGTSGAVRRFVSRPLTDPEGRTFCYAFDSDRWLIGGPTNNGGMALRWFTEKFVEADEAAETRRSEGPPAGRGRRQYRDRLRVPGPGKRALTTIDKNNKLQELIRMAMNVPPGADGLLFLPYLSGERAPYWNSDARGVFAGAALHHGRPHFARAVLEGVLYAVNSVAEVLSELAGPTGSLLASGGFAGSPEWTALLADIADVEVEVPDTYEASAYGAAVMAMVGMGALRSPQDAPLKSELLRVHRPDPARAVVYGEMYGLFKELYGRMEPVFPALAAIQSRSADK